MSVAKKKWVPKGAEHEAGEAFASDSCFPNKLAGGLQHCCRRSAMCADTSSYGGVQHCM